VNDRALWLSAKLSIKGNENQVDDRVLVIFDGRPPDIQSATVAQAAIWRGAPTIGISLDIVDLSGVDRVEAWVLEKPPVLEDLDPKKAQLLAVPDPGPYRPNDLEPRPLVLQIAAPKEKAGQYHIALRVTDKSGQASNTLKMPLTFWVVEKKIPPPEPLVGDLRGRVMLGPNPGRGVTVEVKDHPELRAVTDSVGQFVIKNVPGGDYALLVSGRVGSGKVVTEPAEHPISLKAKPNYQGKVVIKASLQFAEPPKK
jgi:hypothetical protein